MALLGELVRGLRRHNEKNYGDALPPIVGTGGTEIEGAGCAADIMDGTAPELGDLRP